MNVRLVLPGLLLALLLCTACPNRLPDDERASAEKAFQAAALARRCAPEKFRAAEDLIEQAHAQIAAGEFDRARAAFIAAERLIRDAEEEASRNPDCRPASPSEGPAAAGSEVVPTSASDRFDDPDFVLERVHFPFDSHDLTVDARQVLADNGEWMLRHPEVPVRLEGHCDDRGSTEYNLSLGERRAAAVRQYLIDLGIDPDRVSILSFGEERPIDEGDAEQALARNRRVEFVKVR